MTHIAIQEQLDGKMVSWLGRITGEEVKSDDIPRFIKQNDNNKSLLLEDI